MAVCVSGGMGVGRVCGGGVNCSWLCVEVV